MRKWEAALDADHGDAEAERAWARLLADPAQRQAVLDEALFNRQLAQALVDVDDEAYVRGILTGLQDDRHSSVRRAVVGRLPPRRRPLALVLGIAAAALVLVGLWAVRSVVGSAPVAWSVAGEGAAPLPPGSVVAARDAPLSLTNAHGDRLLLHPGARFQLPDASGSHGRLLQGRLQSSWQPQALSAELHAGDVRVAVRGTRYSLSLFEQTVRCHVRTGEVDLDHAGDRHRLTAGDWLCVGPDGRPGRGRLPHLIAWLDGRQALQPRWDSLPLQVQAAGIAPDPRGVAVDWTTPITVQPPDPAATPLTGMTIAMQLEPLRGVQGVLPIAVLHPRGRSGEYVALTLSDFRPGKTLHVVVVLDATSLGVSVDGVEQDRRPLEEVLRPTAAWELQLCGGPDDWERDEPPSAYRLQRLSLHDAALDPGDVAALPER